MLGAMTATAAEPPTLREARAAVFAAVCVLVGAVGHDAFSVSAIPLWALLVGGVAVFLAAQLFTRRECGLPTILLLMGAVQFGLHHLFGFAQKLAADAAPMALAAPAPRGAWWCGHDEPSGVTQAMLHAAGMPPTHHTMTAGMYTAHVVAALTAAWWLRRGEAAVWSLGRALALALITPLVLLAAALVSGCWTPPRRAVTVAARVPDRLGPGRLLRFELARRGPPMTAAAAV